MLWLSTVSNIVCIVRHFRTKFHDDAEASVSRMRAKQISGLIGRAFSAVGYNLAPEVFEYFFTSQYFFTFFSRSFYLPIIPLLFDMAP